MQKADICHCTVCPNLKPITAMMKPYIVKSCILTEYNGEEYTVNGIRREDGMPLVCRKPKQFVEDDMIAFFNDLCAGKHLFTGIKLITESIDGSN